MACLIRKVVVPAAGLGTRLFPATKEQPKEMLPIFAKNSMIRTVEGLPSWILTMEEKISNNSKI